MFACSKSLIGVSVEEGSTCRRSDSCASTTGGTVEVIDGSSIAASKAASADMAGNCSEELMLFSSEGILVGTGAGKSGKAGREEAVSAA